VAEVEVEEHRHDAEQEDRADDAVDDRERAHAEQVNRARERRHERVLDRPFPALPRNGLGEDLEDDPEVGPDHGADEQDRGHLVDVDLPAAGLDALGDEDDRQGVRDGPDEEGDVPPDVALDEVDVALDDAGEADQLVPDGCGCAFGHQSSSSGFSSSNERPVAAKNASSSVAAP
jgi:hypothetical protein